MDAYSLVALHLLFPDVLLDAAYVGHGLLGALHLLLYAEGGEVALGGTGVAQGHAEGTGAVAVK